MSLQDIGKFESLICNNLNPGAAAAATAADNNDDDGDDDVDDDDDDDAGVDNNVSAISQLLNFTTAATAVRDEDDLLSSNAFGVIKDVRVSNILASETDKVSEFDAKNFKQLLNVADPSTAIGRATVLMGGASDA